MGQEVSELRRRLEEREEWIRRALSIQSVGVLFFELGGRITDANAAFERFSGYTREELRSVEWPTLTPPEFIDVSLEAAKNLRTRGQTSPYEKQHIRKDGSRWWGLFAPTVVARKGDVIECIEFIIDISRRKRAEAALKESEEHLRCVVESVDEYAIFTIDPSGHITSWNPGGERVFGYPPAEIIGQHTRILFVPEDQAAKVAEDEMQRAVRDGRAEDERWHMHKDGGRFFASGVLFPMRRGAVLTGFVKVARDTTQRKQTEDALRRSREVLEQDVREGTAVLRQAVDALQEEIQQRRAAENQARALLSQLVTVQEEERKRIARDIHDHVGQQVTALRITLASLEHHIEQHGAARQQCDRARQLAEELDVSLETLTWQLRPPSLDHLGLAAAIGQLVRTWGERSGIQAEFDASALGDLRVSPQLGTHLYHLAQEALHNVVKHAGASRVSVFLGRRGNYLVLLVEDNGRGFDPDRQQRGGGGSVHHQFGIVGMRERAALAGGELEIESSAPGGTTVFVRVPLER